MYAASKQPLSSHAAQECVIHSKEQEVQTSPHPVCDCCACCDQTQALFCNIGLLGMQVKSIVQTLLDALPTPSYSVQEAVSGCLSPLMQGMSSDKEYVQSLAQRLLESALTGPDYPHRHAPRAVLAVLLCVLCCFASCAALTAVLLCMLCCDTCCSAGCTARCLSPRYQACVASLLLKT